MNEKSYNICWHLGNETQTDIVDHETFFKSVAENADNEAYHLVKGNIDIYATVSKNYIEYVMSEISMIVGRIIQVSWDITLSKTKGEWSRKASLKRIEIL